MANKNINILLSLQDKFSKPLQGTTAQIKAQKKQIKACSNVINSWAKNANSKFKKVAGTVGKAALVLGTLGGAISVAGIKAWSGQAMEAATAQIEAEIKLEAVLGNVKSLASGGTAAIQAAKKELVGVAGGIQKVGVIGDEVTIAGQQQLATFQLSTKSISTLSAGMDDLLAQQKGLNATQGDAVTIGNLVGKAMTGQVGALSRVGIIMTDAQEKIMKTGTEEEKAAAMAQILKDNVGGVNEALAQTPQGKIKQAQNLYGDMTEEVGKGLLAIKAQIYGVATQALPVVQEKLKGLVAKLQSKVTAAIAYLKAHKEQILVGMQKVKTVLSNVYKIISTVVGWVIKHGNILIPILAGVVAGFAAFNVIMAIVPMISTLVTVIQGVSAAGGILNAVMAACPAVMIALAIAALVTAGVLLWKNWDKIKAKAQELWGSVKAVFGGIKDSIVGAFDTAKTKVAGVIDWIKDKLGAIGKAIEKVPVLGTIFKGIKTVAGAAKTAITGHATGTSYFSGGQTRINEGGRGEIVNLPSGTQIIPHDVSKKTISQNGRSIILYFIVQGNMIGNKAFMEQCGDYLVRRIVTAEDRV
jgi:phage-related protein